MCRFDSEKDNYIDLMELKLMMEKLGAPQTHLGLKNMIKEVDEDLDGKLSFREVNASVCQNMKLFFTDLAVFHSNEKLHTLQETTSVPPLITLIPSSFSL